MPIKKEFNKDFFKQWSQEMAYVLGYIFADGAVYTNPRGGSYLEFTSTDRELIYKVKNLLSSNHKVTLRKRNQLNDNWQNNYRIQIGSKELLENLSRFGIKQNKSLTIKFPNIPDEFLGHFVRGYFDGDGCVFLGSYFRKDRNYEYPIFGSSFTSGSRDFLSGLLESLKNHTKGGCIYKKNRGYALNFSRRDSVALFKLMYNNVSSDMFLERKFKTFQKAFKALNIAGVA